MIKRIAAIVPAFNEEESIEAVVADINAMAETEQLVVDVIVINDCSKDNTAKVIAALRCVAINLPINLGIGGAVQTGFKYALKNGYDYAIQVDGDGQHPASEIPKIVRAAVDNDYDVVIGSRFISNEGFQSSIMRRIGINYFKWLNRMLLGVVVHDSTSGFRLISRDVLKVVSEYYPDEYPEPEAIVVYSLKKFKIGEVPVTMKERQGGVSSIGTFASVYYMFKVTLAIVFTFTRMKFR